MRQILNDNDSHYYLKGGSLDAYLFPSYIANRLPINIDLARIERSL